MASAQGLPRQSGSAFGPRASASSLSEPERPGSTSGLCLSSLTLRRSNATRLWSTSGNPAVRPERGGHSSEKVLLWSAAGSKSPSSAKATMVLPPAACARRDRETSPSAVAPVSSRNSRLAAASQSSALVREALRNRPRRPNPFSPRTGRRKRTSSTSTPAGARRKSKDSCACFRHFILRSPSHPDPRGALYTRLAWIGADPCKQQGRMRARTGARNLKIATRRTGGLQVQARASAGLRQEGRKKPDSRKERADLIDEADARPVRQHAERRRAHAADAEGQTEEQAGDHADAARHQFLSHRPRWPERPRRG